MLCHISYISVDDLWRHRLTATKVMSHNDAASEASLWKCFDTCIRGLLAFPAPMHAGHKTNQFSSCLTSISTSGTQEGDVDATMSKQSSVLPGTWQSEEVDFLDVIYKR
jgi:cytochrome P450 family 26 subfamily A